MYSYVPAQVLCQAINLLGCILPSAATSASVAAHVMVAMYGSNCFQLGDKEIQFYFAEVKKRVKQLYTKEPEVFFAVLPPTPVALLRQAPKVAQTLFSREKPPVTCPLTGCMVNAMLTKIKLRGGDVGDISADIGGWC